MFYKLGLEFFNGSITTLASDRFDARTTFAKRKPHLPIESVPLIYRRNLDIVGAAQGLNQAAQCVGAILIAPLVKRWPTRTVLSAAIFLFALMTALLLIVDAATGMWIVHVENIC